MKPDRAQLPFPAKLGSDTYHRHGIGHLESSASSFAILWLSAINPSIPSHYEIAGYGCARAYAELLRDNKGARLLNTSLQEEGATDKKLTRLAKSVINLRAKKVRLKKEKKGLTTTVTSIVKKVTG